MVAQWNQQVMLLQLQLVSVCFALLTVFCGHAGSCRCCCRGHAPVHQSEIADHLVDGLLQLLVPPPGRTELMQPKLRAKQLIWVQVHGAQIVCALTEQLQLPQAHASNVLSQALCAFLPMSHNMRKKQM